jgi:regulator of protease activity HflC (stomatin/prohibitin superfamily)
MAGTLLAPSCEKFHVQRFKSPRRVIIRSLLNSRQRWKTKSLERLEKVKALERKTVRLEDSRRHWRKKAQQAEREVRELQSQGERQARAKGEGLGEGDAGASARVAASRKKPPLSS